MSEYRGKPHWALMLGNALDMERQAETIRTEALGTRCPAEDSGGARCTADRLPEHEHRHLQEDLP